MTADIYPLFDFINKIQKYLQDASCSIRIISPPTSRQQRYKILRSIIEVIGQKDKSRTKNTQ